jgi:hypothetical protein
MMRHKSIQTTLDYYAEIQSEVVEDELRRLFEAVLGSMGRVKRHQIGRGPTTNSLAVCTILGEFKFDLSTPAIIIWDNAWAMRVSCDSRRPLPHL